MKRVICLFLLVSLFVTGISSASFTVGDSSHYIDQQYSLGGMIKGWINISLNSESMSSLLTGFGKSITLMELFELNEILPDCVPTNCKTDYETTGDAKTSETFTLNNLERKRFGFKFIGITEGDFIKVEKFNLTVSSNDLGRSTSSQLSIELANLEDNEVEWRAYKPSGEYYNERSGCFSSAPEGNFEISTTKYCEVINLPASTKIEVGTYVTENTGGNAEFLFEIFDAGNQIGSGCSVEVDGPGRINCVMYLETDELKEISVCVSAQPGGESNYKIEYETVNPCGFSGEYTGNYGLDFNIFAKAGKYAPVGTFHLDTEEIKNSISPTDDIELYINNYINSKYNKDCKNGCVIPIEFISGIDNHEITLSDVEIRYVASGTRTTNDFYEIVETPAVINSDFLKFELDKGNFSAPNTFGEHTFSLNLGGNNIFSEEILVEKIPQIKYINANTVPAAYPFEFIVGVEKYDSNSSIIKYEWDFGDGVDQTTNINRTTYTYPSTGDFVLTLTITDSNKIQSTKSFNIKVLAPREAVNTVLQEKIADFEIIDLQIQEMTLFHQNSLKSALRWSILEPTLSDLQQRKADPSNNDQDYVDMMVDLVNLNIPSSIDVTESADSFRIFTEKEAINLEVLGDIGGDSYNVEKADLYKDAIVKWNLKNIEANIDFKQYSGVYGDSVIEILNVFKIKIDSNQARNDSWFIVPNLANLQFSKNDSIKEESGYYYLEISGDSETIEFSTTEKLDLFDLQVVISPELSQFASAIEFTSVEREEVSKQTVLILSIILIIFVVFLLYFIFQEWHKRKREKQLFPDRNELYNLVSFIKSSVKKKIDNREIVLKLRKIGWNQEQIKYIMKKYAGKSTGMVEIIPLKRVLSIFKRKSTPLPNKRILRNPRFDPRKFNKAR